METSDWEKDRAIIGAARSTFDAALRHAIGTDGVSPIVMTYLNRVSSLVLEFEEEPEQMGEVVASIWQDRALELSRPAVDDVGGAARVLAMIGLQLAGLVFELARRQGGQRAARSFGYGFVLVRMETRDRGTQVDADLSDFTFKPLDMLEFICRRAMDLGVPADDLNLKKARRGL